MYLERWRCFGCSHPLVDGSLQLFGRAPMAAFTGDAAQKKETVRAGQNYWKTQLQKCVFVILFFSFYLSFANYIYDSGPKNALEHIIVV